MIRILEEVLDLIGGPQMISVYDVSPLADGKSGFYRYRGDIEDMPLDIDYGNKSVVQIEVENNVLKIIID